MVYPFSYIVNEALYESSSVLFITGSHNIFNNYCVDRLKKINVSDEEVPTSNDLLDDFGLSDTTEGGSSGSSTNISFEEFKRLVPIPNINGKWFCNVSYDGLSDKLKKDVLAYANNPSPNGVLAVIVTDWRNIRQLLKIPKVQKSKDVNLVKLNYPSPFTLRDIIKGEFAKRSIEITGEAAELFQKRMSCQYDKYTDIINQITVGMEGQTLNFDDMFQLMKGIEFFDLGDFVEALLYPLQGEGISTKRKIYKILKSLLDDLPASEITQRLLREIKKYLVFRIAINTGRIPAKVRFSVKEMQERLKDAGPEFKMSDMQFRRTAEIAQMTTLRDWLYMYLMLSKLSTRGKPDEVELRHTKALYSLIHRQILPDTRLDNDIRISNILEEQQTILNNIKYTLEE